MEEDWSNTNYHHEPQVPWRAAGQWASLEESYGDHAQKRPKPLLCSVYQSVVGSAPIFDVVCWEEGVTAADKTDWTSWLGRRAQWSGGKLHIVQQVAETELSPNWGQYWAMPNSHSLWRCLKKNPSVRDWSLHWARLKDAGNLLYQLLVGFTMEKSKYTYISLVYFVLTWWW